MPRLTFFSYFTISLIVAVGAIYHSYSIHEQFYPTVVYLTTNKLCIIGLGNFGFSLALTIGNILIKIFFGRIEDDESNEILNKLKFAITEICIALTSFRSELNVTVVALFLGLLLIKGLHWIANLRMENFARGINVDLVNNDQANNNENENNVNNNVNNNENNENIENNNNNDDVVVNGDVNGDANNVNNENDANNGNNGNNDNNNNDNNVNNVNNVNNDENGAMNNLRNTYNLGKYRLIATLIALLFIDLIISGILCYLLYIRGRFGVLVLFAFEFTILAVSVFSQTLRFVVLLIDHRYHGQWSYKPTVMFLIEHIHDLCHLGLYCCFFAILTTHWGFPIHLMRELFLAFHNLKRRISQFTAYRKIVKILDTQFATLTKEELQERGRDLTCVICFGELQEAKELPCGHVFHLNCLKRWFEQKQECPMCRRQIAANIAGQNVGAAGIGGVGAGIAGGAAGVGGVGQGRARAREGREGREGENEGKENEREGVRERRRRRRRHVVDVGDGLDEQDAIMRLLGLRNGRDRERDNENERRSKDKKKLTKAQSEMAKKHIETIDRVLAKMEERGERRGRRRPAHGGFGHGVAPPPPPPPYYGYGYPHGYGHGYYGPPRRLMENDETREEKRRNKRKRDEKEKDNNEKKKENENGNENENSKEKESKQDKSEDEKKVEKKESLQLDDKKSGIDNGGATKRAKKAKHMGYMGPPMGPPMGAPMGAPMRMMHNHAMRGMGAFAMQSAMTLGRNGGTSNMQHVLNNLSYLTEIAEMEMDYHNLSVKHLQQMIEDYSTLQAKWEKRFEQREKEMKEKKGKKEKAKEKEKERRNEIEKEEKKKDENENEWNDRNDSNDSNDNDIEALTLNTNYEMNENENDNENDNGNSNDMDIMATMKSMASNNSNSISQNGFVTTKGKEENNLNGNESNDNDSMSNLQHITRSDSKDHMKRLQRFQHLERSSSDLSKFAESQQIDVKRGEMSNNDHNSSESVSTPNDNNETDSTSQPQTDTK